MSILTILLYIICIILLLILIFLIIGLKFRIFLDFHEKFYGKFELYIFKKIRIIKKEIPEKEDKDKEKEKEDEEKEDEKNQSLKEKYEKNKDLINEIIENNGPFIEIVKIIKDSIKHSKTEGSIIYGLESPVDTAELGGFLWTITGILNSGKNTNITVDPVWNEFYLEFTIDTNFELSLLIPIIKILKIIIKNPTRAIVLKLIKRKLRKKDEPKKNN